MTINVYPLGELVRVAGVLEDAASVDTDPAALTVKYKKPNGVVTTLIYATDAALVKDSVGNYHADINCDLPGMYTYRFASTGNGQAAAEKQFRVSPSGLD